MTIFFFYTTSEVNKKTKLVESNHCINVNLVAKHDDGNWECHTSGVILDTEHA